MSRYRSAYLGNDKLRYDLEGLKKALRSVLETHEQAHPKTAFPSREFSEFADSLAVRVDTFKATDSFGFTFTLYVAWYFRGFNGSTEFVYSKTEEEMKQAGLINVHTLLDTRKVAEYLMVALSRWWLALKGTEGALMGLTQHELEKIDTDYAAFLEQHKDVRTI